MSRKSSGQVLVHLAMCRGRNFCRGLHRLVARAHPMGRCVMVRPRGSVAWCGRSNEVWLNLREGATQRSKSLIDCHRDGGWCQTKKGRWFGIQGKFYTKVSWPSIDTGTGLVFAFWVRSSDSTDPYLFPWPWKVQGRYYIFWLKIQNPPQSDLEAVIAHPTRAPCLSKPQTSLQALL